MKKIWNKYWDEIIVYAFTVLCVLFGPYILTKEHPDFGVLPVVAALIVAVFACFGIEYLRGLAKTPEQKAAKKSQFMPRLLFSGVAGLASTAYIPGLVKTILVSVGVIL